jgi:hypothetical protein
VYLVAAQPVRGAELGDFRLNLTLERLKPCELVHSPGKALQVLNDQRAQRGVTLRSGDSGVAVNVIGNRDRNILHSYTVTLILWRIDARSRGGAKDRAARPAKPGSARLLTEAIDLDRIPHPLSALLATV